MNIQYCLNALLNFSQVLTEAEMQKVLEIISKMIEHDLQKSVRPVIADIECLISKILFEKIFFGAVTEKTQELGYLMIS